MTSIRRFVYAAALTVIAFSFAPNLASAQEARGRFVLTHEVQWQTTVLSAGEYEFSFKPEGPDSDMLFVRKLSGREPDSSCWSPTSLTRSLPVPTTCFWSHAKERLSSAR